MNIKSVCSQIILVEDSKVDQEHRNRAESQPNICYCEKTLILSNVFNEDVMNNFRSISYRAAKPF